jgi:hypothetical protein
MGAILTPAFDALQRAYDNRAEPEVDEDVLDVDAQTDIAIELIGRACRARDAAATADLLREAAKLLRAIADEVEAA